MRHDVDQLLDTLAGLLRDFGEHAFDLERQEARKTRSVFDQWAQHLLTGVAAPAPQAAAGHTGLRQLFLSHRKQEQSEFQLGQDVLRDVVWMFVSSLNREVSADRIDDAVLGKTLAGLTSTLQTASPADLRREALATVRQVHGLLSVRRERQQREYAAIASRLEAVGSQLEVARRESTIDALTQLFNRKAFDEQLERLVALSGLGGGPPSLMMFDVDHFKQVNDTFGHPAGDAVLKAVAQTCVRTFKRKSDFVARYGGEELVVLVRDASPAEVRTMAERAREAISALEVKHDGRSLHVTASAGVATLEVQETGAAWLARADAALYRAKHGGRNRVEA